MMDSVPVTAASFSELTCTLTAEHFATDGRQTELTATCALNFIAE